MIRWRFAAPAAVIALVALSHLVVRGDGEAAHGWFGEALPAHMARAAESGVYEWNTGHGMLIEMVYVPPGEFQMGSDELALSAALRTPRHLAQVKDGFYIGRHETTWAEYLAFCRDTHRTPPPLPAWGVPPLLPVTNVTWQDARAYAEWAGLSLPTITQWEKAARGTDARPFPWGATEPTSTSCVFGEDLDPSGARVLPERGRPESVGSHPLDVSPYGALDMGGNVSEWCVDQAGSASEGFGATHLTKGGAFNMTAQACLVYYQCPMPGAMSGSNIGLRPVKRAE